MPRATNGLASIPTTAYRLAFSIGFNHPAIDRTGQSVTIDFAEQSYVREVARARTFGFMQEVEWLRENGLAQGGGLDNAVVLDEYRVLNADGLRYNDEFVKHKVLDAIGDLYLLGHPLLASFVAHKSGHALNNAAGPRTARQPPMPGSTSLSKTTSRHPSPSSVGSRCRSSDEMWLLRLLAVLTVIAVGCGIAAFLLTRDSRYLQFSWRLFRYSLVIALLVFALMIIERVAIIPL
jgi:hypothetical protein